LIEGGLAEPQRARHQLVVLVFLAADLGDDPIAHLLDARWYVDNGVLPVKPAGSPVE
jgi:hypothetical protein